MKKLTILLFSILISFNSYSVKLDFSSDTFCHKSPKAQLRNNLYYLPNQQKPYSGENLCIYLSNGQYYSQGEIINGKQEGWWTWWKENGERWKKEEYKDGNKTGYKKINPTFNDNDLESELIYKDGKLIGETKYVYYKNGQKYSEVNYKDGKEDGEWTYWKKNGQREKVEYYKDGEIVGGIEIDFFNNGQIYSELNYKYGKQDGKSTWWHENGQKNFEETYKNGIPEGNWNAWDKNGLQSAEGFFKDGTGSYIEFFENNQKSYELIYKDGVGKETFWYENGQKEMELNYKDGELDGKYTQWYGNGQTSEESNYKNGKCISGYCYEKAEAEKLAKEKAEVERLAKGKIEAEKLAKEKAEVERLAKGKIEAELKSLYVNQIAARVRNNWRYQGAEDYWSCDVYILQDINGIVQSVNLQSCDVDNSAKAKSFKNSIERAVYKSSPLPTAPDESVFDREIIFIFKVN